jgi:hypothetical protein
MIICPYCGNDDARFLGFDDGGGDYGDSICEYYFCDHCQQEFEAGCIEAADEAADES